MQHPLAKSAEKISIKYEKAGVSRTYRPDFILGDKIIELKPKAMLALHDNQLKFAAAQKLLGDKFLIFTEDNITKVTIQQLQELVAIKRVKLR